MKKLFLLMLVVIMAMGLGQVALAADALVVVSPSSFSKNVASNFDLTVSVKADGNKVCVVKGKLELSKISCQSIVIASGLMPIVSPTCQDPNFTLGIPKCVTADKNLFTISAVGNVSGSSSVDFSSVKVYSDGALISSGKTGGNYDFKEPVVESAPSLKTETPKAETETETQAIPAPVLFDISAKQVAVKTNNINIYFWLLVVLVIVLLLVAFGAVEVLRRLRYRKIEKIKNINNKL